VSDVLCICGFDASAIGADWLQEPLGLRRRRRQGGPTKAWPTGGRRAKRPFFSGNQLLSTLVKGHGMNDEGAAIWAPTGPERPSWSYRFFASDARSAARFGLSGIRNSEGFSHGL
jgi:hypothetical protein